MRLSFGKEYRRNIVSDFVIQGLLNISLPWQIQAQEETAISSWRECSKKSVQQGRSYFDARSVHEVREHGKMATCLRVAASAKAGNASPVPS
jgi:hypothetical protein